MYKFLISIKKEALLFLNDKTGLMLMFGMPILLVFIITIIQDSVYQIVDSNRISILVSNRDSGLMGNKFVSLLDSSGMFNIKTENSLDPTGIKKSIADKKALTAIYIPANFSSSLQDKSKRLSHIVMADFGLDERTEKAQPEVETSTIKFFHDPSVQENYCSSIINVLHAHLSVIESTQMIESIYKEMGASSTSPRLKESIKKDQIKVERIVATEDAQNRIPSSTQHNVPAWTIFAMFFMVVSLGTNIVKERTSGSFLRIKTMPANFSIVLISKQFIYTAIAFLQVLVIFSIGLYILPLINLPPLEIPENIIGTIAVVFICSFAAVSYALMIGTVAKTEDQSNGFGAISIIIFAALGGVWVPTFIMPHYLQVISLFSPLHWCIEGFYVLFLKHGSWNELVKPIIILTGFSLVCQLIAFFKIKFEKY